MGRPHQLGGERHHHQRRERGASSPPTATVTVGQRTPVTASVTGTPDASVTWSVNGVANGNPSVGQDLLLWLESVRRSGHPSQTAGTLAIQIQNPGNPAALSNPVPFVILPFDVSVGTIFAEHGATARIRRGYRGH